MKKVLLVTFSDNADHQDTLFGMYEEMRNRSDWDAYLLCIKTPKVELQKSDHTWLVDCPERPGVTKKTFNLPLLVSIIHRIRKEHFDAIYFESLHTWNLPIMLMSGKAKTYQVIHEVIPHEGDSQVKMVDLMNKAVVKFADTIVLRNKTYIQDSRLIYCPSDGNIQTPKGKTNTRRIQTMMKNAKTYLTRIQAAATERELTGIEIAFKQDMSINCDDLGRLCRAAEDKRYTLRNNAETLRLKDILFQRTKAEMDAYHDMSRKPESWTAEDIAHQRIRFCSIWQVIEEAELADEYEAWKEANPNA